MAVLENIFQGVGNAAKGVADFTFGPGRQTQLAESFAIMKGDFSREAKEAAAQKILQTVNPAVYDKLKAADQNAFRPSDGDVLSPKQQKKAAKIKSGIKPSADTVVRAKSRAASQKQGTTFDKLDARTKNRKSAQAFFDAATDEEGNFLNPKDEERYNKAITELDPEETPVNQKPTTNIGKRAAERDRAAAFVGPPAPGPGPAPFRGPGNRADQEGNFQPPEVSRQFQEQVQQDPRFADFFSGGTNPFEVNLESTTPKSFSDLGMTSAADQEEFTQLQKALPDMDLRQEVNKSPAEYKKLFDAIRKGRITNKRAVELIKESLGQ
jgi:hypothetical protein